MNAKQVWGNGWRQVGFGSLIVGFGVAIAACSGPSATSESPPETTAAPEQSAEQPDLDATSNPTEVETPEGDAETYALPIDSASRIVALTSLSADLVNALAPDRLVAIPGSSLFRDNPDFADLPVVSEGRTPPNLETIVSLEPDLVIGAVGFHDQALAQLGEMGIATLGTETSRWEDLPKLINTLAQVTEADAAPLAGRYQSCFPTDPEPSESVLVLVSRQPLLSPNANSWAGDLLSRFNADNVTAQLQGQGMFDGYVTLSAEKVLAADPDVLMLVDTGEGLAEQLQQEPFWNQLKAVQTGEVHTIDYFGMVNPGSLDSIAAACDTLATTLLP
jgi:iron complex transport system substrate-binding protein